MPNYKWEKVKESNKYDWHSVVKDELSRLDKLSLNSEFEKFEEKNNYPGPGTFIFSDEEEKVVSIFLEINKKWKDELDHDFVEYRDVLSRARLRDFYSKKSGHSRYLENAPYYNVNGIWAKKCTKCSKEFPRNVKHWRKHSSSKDGLSTDCLECRRSSNREDGKKSYSNNPLKQKINNQKCTIKKFSNKNAMIDELIQTYNVDTLRIYATGFSNGAAFTYDLACRLSQRIAAIAPVGENMTQVSYDECEATKPTGIISFHGTADESRPYDGIEGYNLSYEQINSFWTTLNETETEPTIAEINTNT